MRKIFKYFVELRTLVANQELMVTLFSCSSEPLEGVWEVRDLGFAFGNDHLTGKGPFTQGCLSFPILKTQSSKSEFPNPQNP